MATVTVRPNGAGSVTTYSFFGGSANWDCVDESSPDDDSTFVSINDGDTAGDLYTVGSSGLSAGDTINSVTIYARAKTVGGADSFQFQAESIYGVEVYGGAVSVTEEYVDYDTGALTVIPTVGDPWTLAALNALQIGTVAAVIEVRIRLTQMYAVIDYTPGPTGRSWGQIIG